MCLKLLKKSIMAAVMNSNPKSCRICIQHSCMHQLERKVTKQKIIFTHNYTIIPATPLLSLVVVMESFNARIFKNLASMSQRACMNHTNHTTIKINGEQQWSLCELTQTRTVALFKAHGPSSGPGSIQTDLKPNHHILTKDKMMNLLRDCRNYSREEISSDN